jgi:hypothetical protein
MGRMRGGGDEHGLVPGHGIQELFIALIACLPLLLAALAAMAFGFPIVEPRAMHRRSARNYFQNVKVSGINRSGWDNKY